MNYMLEYHPSFESLNKTIHCLKILLFTSYIISSLFSIDNLFKDIFQLISPTTNSKFQTCSQPEETHHGFKSINCEHSPGNLLKQQQQQQVPLTIPAAKAAAGWGTIKRMASP